MSGVLGIDAGSTGVTAVVVDADGSMRSHARQHLAQHHPEPGRVEHAPEEIWQATLEAVRQVLAGTDAADLTGIGITDQRDTLLLWDRETLGAPRRAIGGQDRRTTEVCARLRAAGHEARVRELTGLPLDPRFAATRLTWLAEHEPRTWGLVEADRYAVGSVGSYLVARMTRGVEHVTDVSNASRTLLHDLTAGDWSDELCALFGVPRDALPEVVPSWGEVATTDPRSFLGLSLPVTGLAGHGPAALVGQACFDVGDTQCTYGTASTVLTHTGAEPVRSDDGLLTTAAWRSPAGRDTFALEGTAPAADAAADAESIEVVASGVRDVLAAMPVRSSLRVDGPASADDPLCQLQADRTGRPVERARQDHASARGAALPRRPRHRAVALHRRAARPLAPRSPLHPHPLTPDPAQISRRPGPDVALSRPESTGSTGDPWRGRCAPGRRDIRAE